MNTPWGRSDYATEIAPGITSVGTPSHGGIRVCAKLMHRIPEYMLANHNCRAGWFEEDCDWAIPFCVFQAEILAAGEEHACKAIRDEAHDDTLKNWHPDAYERFYQVALNPGESYIRDKQLFDAAHASNWVVISASGRPDGMVDCYATLGGRGRIHTNEQRRFLVPATDYETRGHFGFVIDAAKYQEVAPA